MTISAKTQEQAEAVIRSGLASLFDGKVHFTEIRSKVMLDAEEEEFLWVWAIYEREQNNQKTLDPRLLNSFYQRIKEQLFAVGLDTIPVMSYRPKDEDDAVTAAEAARRQARRA